MSGGEDEECVWTELCRINVTAGRAARLLIFSSFSPPSPSMLHFLAKHRPTFHFSSSPRSLFTAAALRRPTKLWRLHRPSSQKNQIPKSVCSNAPPKLIPLQLLQLQPQNEPTLTSSPPHRCCCFNVHCFLSFHRCVSLMELKKS